MDNKENESRLDVMEITKEDKEKLEVEEKVVENKVEDNNPTGGLLIISRISILLSALFCIYEKYITFVAGKYPKAAYSGLQTYSENRNGSIAVNNTRETFCHYIQTHSLANEGRILLWVLVAVFFILIIIAIINHKKTAKFTLLRIIIGAILSISIIAIGLTSDIRCTLDQTWKPILYLYPTEKTNIEVKLDREDLLKTTYPKYKNSWIVEADKDGSLYDENGNYYYALYWDEIASSTCEFEDGFYVTKDNAISFLEEKLTFIGLNGKERNEFIMYWLPVLEENEKSIVQFDLTEELQEKEKIIITPKPDSLLRIHINIKKVNHKVNIKEQKLVSFERVGFTAIEWGGTNYS